MTDGAWETWRNHVLIELKRLDDSVKDNQRAILSSKEELKREIDLVRVEVVKLKIKAGVWGAVAGAIPAIVYILISQWKG